MTTRTCRPLLPALALFAAAGCHTCGKKHERPCCPPGAPPGGALIAPAPLGAATGPTGDVLMPTPLPPAGAPPAGPAPAPPPTFPATPSGYPPVASLYPPPSAPADRPAVPPAVAPAIRLLPPQLGPSSPAAPRPQPPATPPAATTPALPVGIPDFAVALPERVAAGRKPTLDGLDWLKANGYKGALELRRPGASDTADRKQFEQRGLKFTSLEVSPATLSWATVEAFRQAMSDPAAQPLFVYDADGSLAGGLWYLYFRRVERLPDEAARLRAGRLGMREGADGAQRDMMLAVQRLLAQP
jgi:protein tyrosine phosphatase (PTP) superfamily phosphohydrolase (DUF442 family)